MRLILSAVLLLLCAGLAGCDVLKSAQVESAVIAALEADSRTSQYTFEVSNEDGKVTITGEVFIVAEIDIVTEIAKGVDGVETVLNRVHVPEEGSGMMQDHVVPSPYF